MDNTELCWKFQGDVMRIVRLLHSSLIAVCALGTIGSAQTVTFIHAFNISDGQYPVAGTLAQARDGSLYGTAYAGGGFGQGTLFRQNVTSKVDVNLHSFAGTDGANPVSGPILATDGNMYGTTQYGGVFNYGVLYRVDTTGTLTVIHDFTGGSDGAHPEAPPIQGSDGNLYGMEWTPNLRQPVKP